MYHYFRSWCIGISPFLDFKGITFSGPSMLNTLKNSHTQGDLELIQERCQNQCEVSGYKFPVTGPSFSWRKQHNALLTYKYSLISFYQHIYIDLLSKLHQIYLFQKLYEKQLLTKFVVLFAVMSAIMFFVRVMHWTFGLQGWYCSVNKHSQHLERHVWHKFCVSLTY